MKRISRHHTHSRGIRAVWLSAAVFALGITAPTVHAATYVWNNTGNPWETGSDWTPAGPPTAADIASFDPTVANPAGVIFNPTINAADTALALNINNNYLGGNYSFSGSGTITAGSSTVTGLQTRGFGTTTINIGTGTAASLLLNGPTTSGTGNIDIGTDTTLVLTGNTIATVTGTMNEAVVRGGDLVLDNTVGGANTAHLATTGTIQLNGGGSTFELRGNSAGTNFGTFGPLGAAGAGDTTLRTVQSGTGALSVTFATLSRANTSGIQYFENIGSGFVGATGAPTIAFTTAPSTVTGTGGLISTSTTTVLPYDIVTSRASTAPTAVVTGRWAAYNSGTVGAVATTSYTTDFSGAAAKTNVLFAPAGSSSTTLAATTAALASVVFEPTGSGATLALGASNIVTSGLLLSGGNSLTVTGTGNLIGSGSGTSSLSVLSPGASLITSNVIDTGTTTMGGAGFIVLNGTTNQVPLTATGNFNIGGGTLRATSTNFNLGLATSPTLRFRGGEIEYNVSGSSYTFNNALGAAAGNVNWTSSTTSPATSNSGSGGFSAYSTTAGNTLTVNIGGSATPSTLTWDTAYFVPDSYALKFGSTQSNAMVNFQNPIALDGGTAGTYNAREVNVTGGVGGDGTTLSGVISGSASTDFLKSGTGTLTLTASNTYKGRTIVEGGTLVASSTSGTALGGTAGVIVNAGGTVQMGAANQFSATTPAPLTLNGTSANAATFSVNGNSQGSTTANGVGALTLASGSSNNVIDFNSKNGVVTFASFTPNGATLSINNYLNNSAASGGPDELIFNQDENANLGNIVFTGYGASTEAALGGGFFEVFPGAAAVPEPATVAGGLLMVGALGWTLRRRSVRALPV